ncbi:MAG: Wzz/FepE/Etk N-terminal domain-containing protein [Candidatus Faecousia sp.]|nr:Wzz/FepE/Etk N-terminal domain-containing protein [Candidatus Faecousia sp.]
MRMETEDTIDLLHLAKVLWKHAIAIVLVGLIFGTAAFIGTKLFVTPMYDARALMYVNSTNLSLGGSKVSISTAEISAAKSLVDTYSVILKTRMTLEDVIEQSGVDYTYEQLDKMVTAGSVNGTEVFYINVKSADPAEAELLANTIALVLPDKIASIVDGSSVRIVDYAVKPAAKSSPSTAKNAVLGALLGVVLSCGLIIVMDLMDDQIHDVDYLTSTYSDIPVLAVIPDLLSKNKSSYYYYRRETPKQAEGK